MPSRPVPSQLPEASLRDRTSPHAIAARARESRELAPLRAQAEPLAKDMAALAQAEAAAESGDDTRQQRRTRERKKVSLHARELGLLRRDDAVVRAVLERKGAIDVMSAVGTTPCDELL